MPKRARPRVERSAGGVVLRRVDGTLYALVIKDPYGNWGLPKGHVEAGESAGAAAMREVGEETGLAELDIGPELATIDWYFRAGARLVHKFCAFYLMWSEDGDPVPEVAEGITECRWVPLTEAEGVITYDNAREVVRTARGLMEGDEAPFAGR